MRPIFKLLALSGRLIPGRIGRTYRFLLTVALAMLTWGAIPFLVCALAWIAFGQTVGIVLFAIVGIPLFLFVLCALALVNGFHKGMNGGRSLF